MRTRGNVHSRTTVPGNLLIMKVVLLIIIVIITYKKYILLHGNYGRKQSSLRIIKKVVGFD